MKKLPNRIDVRFPPHIAATINDLVERKIYKNRSRAVRHLIEVGIETITAEDEISTDQETV